MKISEAGELRLLQKIRDLFPMNRGRGISIGIGDDAAEIVPGMRGMLATCDVMTEGVHFSLSLSTLYQVGYKLVCVNVSDINSMGGTALYALIGAMFSEDTEGFDEFFLGVSDALKTTSVELIGGDLAASKGGCAFSATVLGASGDRTLTRGGARAGQRIFVTGSLGDSASGLEVLRRIGSPVDPLHPGETPLAADIMRPLLQRHLMPLPREGRLFAPVATSMMDISDGLLMDLGRVCAESAVGAVIRMAHLPVSAEALQAAGTLGFSAVECALSGGEDYELLFTSDESVVDGAVCIGEIIEKGMFLEHEDGTRQSVAPRGYEHFGGGLPR